jgi:hypothetical protein
MLQQFLDLESLIKSLLAAKDLKDYDIIHLSLAETEWQFLKSLNEVFAFYQPVTVKMFA